MRSTRTAALRSLGSGLAVVLLAAGAAGADRDDGRPARNVVFVVGDGMGAAHRELIRLATVGPGGVLEMDRLRYRGWARTDPVDPDDVATDSAATATAFSTGVRTDNGAIAVDVEGNPVRTLLELAADLGKATGLVTTSQVTDATPASFASHTPDRGDHSEIARQYLEESEVDVVLGGGEDWWYPAGDAGRWRDNPPADPAEESRGTAGDLVARAQVLGYAYVSDGDELAAAAEDKLLGLFANEEMFEHAGEGDGAAYDPSVPVHVMAAKALDVLSRDRDGFFLLLEEEGIDAMAHDADAAMVVEAGRALEAAVAVVRDFAADRGDTLVVVVGDHETGGLVVDLVESGPLDQVESGPGVLAPTLVDGTGSVAADLVDHETRAHPSETVDPANSDDGPDRAADGVIPLVGTDLTITVDWTTGWHTAAAVPVTAEGPGASAMTRVTHSTDIHDLVLDAMTRDGDRDDRDD
ncbi:alkaline phosphatase [Georgenia subflava]|uniref:Alkaline phosphatase n=2 Tax=Georgenia subflava TaxID=1622177 RepID=A0A6N7EE10_9MICO|nr:alkaline phosphatase [Georgenia subflava]